MQKRERVIIEHPTLFWTVKEKVFIGDDEDGGGDAQDDNSLTFMFLNYS